MVFYNPSDFDFRIDDLLGQIRAIKDMGIGVGLCLPTITRSADLRHLGGWQMNFGRPLMQFRQAILDK